MQAPAWRVWTYAVPSVVLGCAQRGLYADVLQRLDGRHEVLMRASGGGAVLSGPWLVGVSVALPPSHDWVRESPVDSYREFGHLHVAALKAMGVPSRTLPPLSSVTANGTPEIDWACFGGLSAWELVNSEGRKLTGLAQRRCKQGVLLVAGTLTGLTDWALLCQAMGRPDDAPALNKRTVCAAEIRGMPVDAHAFASHLEAALEAALGHP